MSPSKSVLISCALGLGTACSVLAQGFPNQARTPGELLSGLNAPEQGRTAIIAYHHGLLFTVPESPASVPPFDAVVRSWDISSPESPQVLELLGTTQHPVNAHGYLKSGDYLVLGPNWPPEAPWSFQAAGPLGTLTRTAYPELGEIIDRGDLYQPWVAGPTFWSYDEVSEQAVLEVDGVEVAQWDHLGLTGVIGHPFIVGDLLIFASDQSRTGVATYDIGDPTSPVLLDVLTTGGPGGYWPELWGGEGQLYVVFPYRTGGNGFRVVDATDPTDLVFLADVPLAGDEAMYVQFQDEYAFIADHKVDLRSFESVLFLDGLNRQRPDGGTGISTSQFGLPVGNLLVTGGSGEHQGMAIWAHQAEPDTRGPSVGFHIPQAGRTDYPVGSPISLLIHETLETPTIVNGVSFIARPLGGEPISGRLVFSFNDMLTFTPGAPLAADTTYEVILPAGGIEDVAGNGIEGYSFTFSTGSTLGGNGPPVISSFTATPYPAAPGQDVALAAAASDPDTEAVEYRFDFGDGSAATPWSADGTSTHAYAAAGHFRATVQARDPGGALSTRATTVTVVSPAAGPAPTRSSPILCSVAERRVWKVNPDNDTLTALDADTLALVVEVPTCDDPRSVARAASGELWVACHGDDRVRVHDAAGGVVADLETGYGSAPFAVAFTPDGTTAFLSLYGSGELRRFDAASRAPTGQLPLGPTPRALAVTGDGGTVLVSRFISPADAAELWEVDASGLSLVRTLRIAKFGGDDHRDTTANGRGVANYLAGLAISPDSGSVWVASTKTNTDRGLIFGPDLDQDNSVRTLVSRLDLASGQVSADIDLDNSDSASAALFSPLGDYLFVALQGNDEVIVLDALEIDQANGLGSFVTRLGAGAAPQGLCVDGPSQRTFVADFLGRGVSALETGDLFSLGDKNVISSQVSTVAGEALPPQVLAGKRLFYHSGDPRMSAEGYLSCASCHVDAGHDGRVWDFTGRGEGLRNTTDLRGRSGTGHGNVHWTANFDEIQDFENDIRGAFGGAGFMDDADFEATSDTLGTPKAGLSTDLDALAAYVSSLTGAAVPRSPFRAPDGSLTPAALAGRGHFQDLGCASCHLGTAFTDSTLGAETLHDVGTLRSTSGQRLGGPLLGIDTPTLRGVWAGAPYLHDGSAETLQDVFRIAGGELVAAESGAPSNGAFIVADGVEVNNDDTVHGRAYVNLGPQGATLTLNGVEGGAGGVGALEFRYSSSNLSAIDVSVGGQPPRTVELPFPGNSPSWRHTSWRIERLEDVPLAAGATNTVVVEASAEFPNLSLDDVLVTTADELALAEPHRQVQDLSPGEQDELMAFLVQLDGSPDEVADPPLFADGFEAGNTTAWSSVAGN